MSTPPDRLLLEVSTIGDQFAIEGVCVIGEEIEAGHINTTYLATYEQKEGRRKRYILQRVNELVFKDPEAVMLNVAVVTQHINNKVLREKKDAGGQTLSLFPARSGASWIKGKGGGLWRCYNFIEGCQTYDVVENTRQAYQAAKAFGAFQDLVSDLPASELTETIPGFHDTRARYDHLLTMVAADPCDRVKKVQPELDYIESCNSWLGKLLELQTAGELTTRITHNDTKVNNVMIDSKTDEAVCVIDLDTVMPGLSLFDFGDLVRSATTPASEDERDLSKVEMRMPIFEALVEGYLSTAGNFLSPLEIDLLAFSGKVISLETGIRFLTDYLEGDLYFKTSRDEQNLDRCRAQLKLVQSIEEQEPKMNDFVKKVAHF